MEGNKDFANEEVCLMKKLDDDTTLQIFKYLEDPRDLARAMIVSHSWRHIVIKGRLWRNFCIRQFPEIHMFESTKRKDEVCCSTTARHGQCVSDQSLEVESFAYCKLFKKLHVKPSDRSCILEPLSASSTDNFPEEGIAQTLYPLAKHSSHSSSYWSSKGQSNSDVPESLTYQLLTRLCVVHEIRIRPFKAYFQRGLPIYSAKYVRFRLGYSCSPISREMQENDGPCTSTTSTDRSLCKDYIWTYISPEFPMAQADLLQSFKLPQPVLCIGGILQVELLGRLQTQRSDRLYYICICHVNVLGTPLYDFDFDMVNGSLALLQLESNTQDEPSNSDGTSANNSASAPGRWRSLAERFRQVRGSYLVHHHGNLLTRFLQSDAVGNMFG